MFGSKLVGGLVGYLAAVGLFVAQYYHDLQAIEAALY